MIDSLIVADDDVPVVRADLTEPVAHRRLLAEQTTRVAAMRPSESTGLVVGPRLAAELARAFAARRCSGA
ncbi:MAG: hypothetical protein HYR85_17885 [Planctomycetes bacterium]|nr:hypothetical protein [Planctomycetota bacterium]MBI3843706.1 hypothetical protein [Planctomycetota bacterium]